MIDVISCLTLEHDLRLVVLAAIICIAGAVTFNQLILRCVKSSGLARLSWIGIGAVGLGTTVWCTHFIAMLSYQAHVPVVLDPVLTLTSLILPIFGFFASIAIVVYGRSMPVQIFGNILLGGCISGLHYLGMMAYRVDGLVQWDYNYIIASVVLCCIFTTASFLSFKAIAHRQFNIPAISLFSLAVLSLHFTGMTAMKIIPLAISDTPMDSATFIALSMATALAGLFVIALGAVAYFLDMEQRRSGYAKLLKMATTDGLTGLANRNAYMENLNGQLATAADEQSCLAVIGIDINKFKEVNDAHGHLMGDRALQMLARNFRTLCTDGEFVARLGGDEFAITKPYNRHAELTDFVEDLKVQLTKEMNIEGTSIRLNGSIGIACYPEDGDNRDTLRNNADLAMNRAQKQALNSICFFTASMDEEARIKRELSKDLAVAMSEGQLQLHYQIQASMKSRKVCGIEALLRWTHPIKGNIPPDRFIPIAEESGLIIRIGEWVIRKACEDAASLDSHEKVAVNLSAVQLTQNNLPAFVHRTLLETGLAPHRLEVELTETAILEDKEHSLHILRQIKALGVKVALDDFGTGYSSLEILRSFPFDQIKLDRFFLAGIENSAESRALVRSVLSIGQGLGIPILAEGVETDAQLAFLRDEGCDEFQGFLLGRPTRLEDIASVIGTDVRFDWLDSIKKFKPVLQNFPMQSIA